MRFPFVALLLLGGCTTTAPVAMLSHVPSDTTQECQGICQSIGLNLSAVVVVANSAGCVCEMPPGAAKAPAAGAAAASSGAVIALAAQQQQQQQNAQKSSDSPPPRPPPSR